jgi:hypothetical protein
MSGTSRRTRWARTGRAGPARVRAVAAGLVVLGALWLSAAPAGWAVSSVRAGWWTSAPVALAPDASPDQLVVQGGTDPAAPVSYAAMAFELEEGELPSSVRLEVAPGSASTPNAVLTACPLSTTEFDAARGGPITDAPAHDCATSVTVEPEEGDIVTYVFDVSAFASSGILAIAVLPTAVSDRVVLAVPTTSSLESTFEASPTNDAFGGAGDFDDFDDPLPATSEGFTSDVSYSPSDFAVPDLPSVVQLGRNPELAAAPAKDAMPIANAVAASEATTNHSGLLAALCIGLVALGIASWAFAARRPVGPA